MSPLGLVVTAIRLEDCHLLVGLEFVPALPSLAQRSLSCVQPPSLPQWLSTSNGTGSEAVDRHQVEGQFGCATRRLAGEQ